MINRDRPRKRFEGVDDDLLRRADDPELTGKPVAITVRDGEVWFHDEETGDVRVVPIHEST